MQRVPVDALTSLLPDKEAVWKAMELNGFYMPPKKSLLISLKYMQNVKDHKVWCPRYGQFQLRPCPTPPPKHEIYQAIMEVSDENRLGIDLGFDHRGIGKVSQYWLLVCLMELAPNHRFFQKDYLPESKRNVKDTREISAADYGFFMNLPE